MLIDTHCHLTDERFANIGKVLEDARMAGVEKVVMPSTSIGDAERAVEIAEKYEQYCLVGIHPEEVETLYWPGGDQQGVASQDYLQGDSLGRRRDMGLVRTMEEMQKIIKGSKRVVGVGEIGLDFYWDKERKTEEKQVRLFRRQMELAVENDLPVAIHMRDAEVEMKTQLLKMRWLPRGQFHCFAGSREFLEMILAKGYYVSFGGNITYKSAGNLREILKQVPLDRLLLETDSPYLPPEPLRGTVNTPANVKIVAEFVASELNLNLKELAEITSQNTKCLYSLEN